jgi:hypothetical protein
MAEWAGRLASGAVADIWPPWLAAGLHAAPAMVTD